MTNSQAISKWLQQCPSLNIIDDNAIDTDWLNASAESFGMYKQPSDNKEQFIDGSILVTDYYYFLARQSVQQELDRTDNHEFMVSIEEWISEQEYSGNLPNIDGIENVEVTNSFYMQEAEEEEGIYQLSIGITYLKRR